VPASVAKISKGDISNHWFYFDKSFFVEIQLTDATTYSQTITLKFIGYIFFNNLLNYNEIPPE